MIGIVQMVITPAMLAITPPSAPAPNAQYDWQAQRTEIVSGNGETSPKTMWNSMRGTNSYVSSNYVVDDWNSD